MQPTPWAIFLLASAALVLPVTQEGGQNDSAALVFPIAQGGGQTGGLGLAPGIGVPKRCLNDGEAVRSIICSAKLRSGNALVTARDVVVNEASGAGSKAPNVLSAGFFFQETRIAEESTIANFDFPAGPEDKQCKCQFVTDGKTTAAAGISRHSPRATSMSGNSSRRPASSARTTFSTSRRESS